MHCVNFNMLEENRMKRLVTIAFVVAFSLGTVLAQQRTFVGKIGDSQCGLKHPMGMGSNKDCTLKCVRAGGKFILADQKNNVVYQLDDQKTPEKFAGQMVKVTGTLDEKTKTIKVKSIEPAGENPCNPCAKKKGKNPCNPCGKKKP
jgi:hypothetical protein